MIEFEISNSMVKKNFVKIIFKNRSGIWIHVS